MPTEQIIFCFKILVVCTYLFAGVLFYNPIMNVFNMIPSFKQFVETFFYKTGMFGYWGVFTRMTDLSKDLKLTIRTNRGDYTWCFVRDREYIPFLKFFTDNTMILFVHHINPGIEHEAYISRTFRNIFIRAKKYYSEINTEILEFKFEMIGFSSYADKNYVHDLGHPPYNSKTLFIWKKGVSPDIKYDGYEEVI